MKIKICGLTKKAEIDYVNEARPDYIGFVFAESRRKLEFAEASRLRLGLCAGIIPVGVFVDAYIDDIARLHDANIISAAQLHGTENAEYIHTLKERAGIPVIKALRLRGVSSGETAVLAAAAGEADFLLFDSGGGGGECFDWSVLEAVRPALACRGFLAGGINVDNIENAVKLMPFAIDVSSGAETDGLKDPKKIAALLDAVRRVKLL
ncbi:MAG: phosphoribosylanthranilate isomerase [Spirochaetaceae bacterium]|jgi:phosphoribosylanthranilate isomerase|nr:phosphoribosylanthranilate isomerase [Spirochaetaceae bacterium]